MVDWRERVAQELAHAEAARARGNEGMARVCARRAAGWTAEAYLAARGVDLHTTSVLDQMRGLIGVEGLPQEAQPLIAHLLTPKVKDDLQSDSYFPLDADLIAEARELIQCLFPE